MDCYSSRFCKNKMNVAKPVLKDYNCCSWFYCRTLFSPQFHINAGTYRNFLIQRTTVMETDSNPSAQTSHLISLPGYTWGKKLISFFTLSKSVSSICLCHREISSPPHSHDTTQHECMRGRRLHPEARQQSHRAGEKRRDLQAPCDTVNSNPVG